jgi:hypothetical protein
MALGAARAVIADRRLSAILSRGVKFTPGPFRQSRITDRA